MTKTTVSRRDIESLCDRLEARAWSPMILDMPATRRDICLSAGLLRWFIQMGAPVSPIELDIFNGTI